MANFAIIGLGNPGDIYQSTRHNLGFWLLDEIAEKQNVRFNSSKEFHADHLIMNRKEKKVLLKKNVLKFGLFLLMLFIVNIGLSADLFLSIKGSLGILKYLIFFLAFAYFLESETNNKLFFRLIFFIISFVVIDTLIQYLFGSDIFGNEFSTSHGKRL